MDVSGVLSEAWSLYQRFFTRLVLTAAVVFVVLNFVAAITQEASDSDLALLFWGLVNLVLTIVGTFWVQGALVEAVSDVRDGRADIPIGELYARTRPRLPALISAGILAGLGVVLGLILLIVPGLYLLTRWSMIVPVIVLEKRSAGESFTRSGELVKGRGWSVFAVIIITIVGAAVANTIITTLFVWLPDFLSRWIGGFVANSLVVPFVALAWTVMYYRLRGEEEPVAAPAEAL